MLHLHFTISALVCLVRCNTCRAIQRLTKKVAELEAGLSALLSGQAIPPAAAAALIAAISKMRLPSGQLVQALSRPGSLAGVLSRGGAAGSAGGAKSAGGAGPCGGLQVKTDGAGTQARLKVQAAQQQAAEDLDSVIQAINQVRWASVACCDKCSGNDGQRT